MVEKRAAGDVPRTVLDTHELLKRCEAARTRLERGTREGLERSEISALTDELTQLHSHLAQFLQEVPPRAEYDRLRAMALHLARAKDERAVLRAILDSLRPAVPYEAAGIFLLQDGDAEGEIEALLLRGYPIGFESRYRQKVDEGVVGWVIRNAVTLVVDDVDRDERYVNLREETGSEVAVPIIGQGNVIGCINLEADAPCTFTSEHVRQLEDMATYAAVAVERAKTQRELLEAQRFESELEIAREIQLKLLPTSPPRIAGFDVAGLNVPSHTVGGDYFDFIPITEEDWGLVIADVAGKGVPAAMVMASLRAALRARVERVYSIRDVVEDTNRFLHGSTGPERFVTAFYAVLNTRKRALTYINAGHNAPLLLQPGGEMVYLEQGGPLLGVVENASYTPEVVQLERGSLLVMLTDGIVEAGDQAEHEFGQERVEELIRKHAQLSAAEIASKLEWEAVRFQRDKGELDDRTVLVVKRL